MDIRKRVFKYLILSWIKSKAEKNAMWKIPQEAEVVAPLGSKRTQAGIGRHPGRIYGSPGGAVGLKWEAVTLKPIPLLSSIP